jgi:hypothetical protein
MNSSSIKDYENIYFNIIQDKQEYENLANVKCDDRYKELNNFKPFNNIYRLTYVKNEETHGQEENKKE